ncbi:actin depolymerising venom protein gelsolin 1 [Patella vulgata]|uniref:actin depolymerising venom protein gelsolin 1 n=1 Tax=Patella vulgata TaxID=6465 RepID=UPI002180976D|nr:actin depolymerising venom protein gelsolin 1 [Patella vulgata]
MASDPAFDNAGQIEGLEIWRIEKLKVVAQDKSSYGTFYSGDSYICLYTKKLPNSNKLQWNLHFWLGKDTSQDEQGVAAYKTVELDDYLGGGPVQYREVQDHESKLFLSYFKKGIKYLDGGVESGFTKVERGVYEKRLMQVKGKRNVRVRQVKCDVSSLNQGDVFILDSGLTIFIWVGPKSTKREKLKAAEVAKIIKDEERGGKAQVLFVEEKWDRDTKFFKALGSEGQISDEDTGGDDHEFERTEQNTVKLYRVSDASGSLEMEEVGSKPLNREDLDSNDCFILDSGPSGIYIWVGKECTKNEKKSAWQNATEFLKKKSYPQWTQISQLVEGAETPLFKQYFSSWNNANIQVDFGIAPRQGSVAEYSDEKFDVTNLHSMQSQKSDALLPDDGSGETKIYRVEDRDLVLLPGEMHGVFYTGDCYILLYTYKQGNRDSYIIYYWQVGTIDILYTTGRLV